MILGKATSPPPSRLPCSSEITGVVYGSPSKPVWCKRIDLLVCYFEWLHGFEFDVEFDDGDGGAGWFWEKLRVALLGGFSGSMRRWFFDSGGVILTDH